MNDPDKLEAEFWPMLSQVMGTPVSPGSYQTDQIPEWDSLRHIELVFAIEESFGVPVPRDQIAELYSDTDTILAFLRDQSSGS